MSVWWQRISVSWLVLALVSVPLFAVDVIAHWHSIPLKPGATLGPEDPDPWLRLTLVRDWLQGGSWYSHEVLRTNAPWAGISSPWTRPLDVVIALLVKLQPASVDLSVRLVRAALILPWLWMTLLLAGLFRAVRFITPLPAAPFMVAALIASALTLWNYFGLANADHHAPLAAVFVWAMGGVVHPSPSRRLTILSGVLFGLQLWISPEALVLIAGVFAWYGLHWLCGMRERARPLPWLATAIAATAVLAVGIERPPAEWMTPVYDSISIVYVFILVNAALLAWAIERLYFPTLRARLLVAGSGALLFLGFLAGVYPLAFHGPMALADPFIFSDFMPRIVEAQPLSHKKIIVVIAMLFQPALALAICAVAYGRGDAILNRRQAGMLGVFVALTLALYVSQMRWYYYAYPMLTLVLGPWLAALFMPEHASARGRWPACWLEKLPVLHQAAVRLATAAAMLSIPLLLLYAAPNTSTDRSVDIEDCQKSARRLIYGGQLNALNGGRPLIFLAPTDLGGEMLFWTPHRIVASNYHREGPGIRYVWEADRITDPTKLRAYFAQRRIEALLLCPAARVRKGSVLQAIQKGENIPDWLTRVPYGHEPPADDQAAVFLVAPPK